MANTFVCVPRNDEWLKSVGFSKINWMMIGVIVLGILLVGAGVAIIWILKGKKDLEIL